jgi:hypothetical protein
MKFGVLVSAGTKLDLLLYGRMGNNFASADRVFGVIRLGHPNRSELILGIDHLIRGLL